MKNYSIIFAMLMAVVSAKGEMATGTITSGTKELVGGTVYTVNGTVTNNAEAAQNALTVRPGSGGFGDRVVIDIPEGSSLVVIGGDGSGKSGGGAGIYMADGAALVENCVISNNTRFTSQAAGVYLNHASAVLRNCLVAGNTAKEKAGGILLVKGLVEHCTIAGNNSINNGGDGTGLRMTGGTAVNNVIYGNPTTAGASDTYVSAGTFKTNLVTQTLSVFAAGDGNVAANPLFRNPGVGNYRLSATSPAAEAGLYDASWMADFTDLAGHPLATPKHTVPMGCFATAPKGTTIFLR